MIKNYFIFVAAIFVISTSVVAQGDERQGFESVLNRLDHNANVIIVDDELYHLPLNVKVYQRKLDGSKYRTVNRYALKEGQNVNISVRQSGTKTYADSIVILE